MTLRWSHTAASQLEAIWDHIAQDKPSAASSAVTKIVKAAEKLSLHPHIGRPGRVKGTRELVVPPFVIIYRIRESAVAIDAILHGSQIL